MAGFARLPGAQDLPRYREAYPRFEVAQAVNGFERGLTVCDFIDQLGETHGLARFDALGNRCQLEYDVASPHSGIRNSWIECDLTLNVTNQATVSCPTCSTKRKSLYFRDKWSCANCLDLVFRSQLVHPLSKKWSKRDKLAAITENGRPRGMHNKTFHTLVSELEELEKYVYGKQRYYASDKYSLRINARWREPMRRDDCFLASNKAHLELMTAGKAKKQTDGQLLGPFTADGGLHREYSGGYETSDPDLL